MSKFVKRSKVVKPEVTSSSSSSEDEGKQVEEKVADVGELPPSPAPKPYSKDLGILRFKDNKMFVGKRFVSFADDDIYRSAAKHFCKDIDCDLEEEITTNQLNDDQRKIMQKELKRGKRLITTHPDYDEGSLKLNDKFTYINPIPNKKKKVDEIQKSPHDVPPMADYQETLERLEKKIKECDDKFVTFEERFQTQMKPTSAGKKEMSNKELRRYYGFDPPNYVL